jgi:hypothetical protein
MDLVEEAKDFNFHQIEMPEFSLGNQEKAVILFSLW